MKVTDPQAETKVVSLNKWRISIIWKVAASVAIIFSIAYFGSLYLKSDPTNKIMLAASDDYNFTISEYETGLFDETEDELIASLIFLSFLNPLRERPGIDNSSNVIIEFDNSE